MPAVPIEFIGMILTVFMTLAILVYFFTNFYSFIVNQLVGASPEVIARKTSGLITLLGAATYDARIYIPFHTDVGYNVQVEKRTLRIEATKLPSFAEKTPSTMPLGVDVGKTTLEGVKSVIGIKTFRKFSSYSIRGGG